MSVSVELGVRQYISALRKYVSCNEEIIATLSSLKRSVKAMHTNNRKFKTSGAVLGTASSISALGLIFAPVTGGLSLALTLFVCGTGIAAVSAGAKASITDIIDSKTFEKLIEDQKKKHEKSVKNIEIKQKQIQEIMKELETKQGSVSKVSVLTVGSTTGQLISGTKNAYDAAKAIDSAVKSSHATNLVVKSGMVTNGVQVAPLLGILGKCFTGIGVALSLGEIALLVKKWDEPHKLIKKIDDIVEKLREICEECKKLIEDIEIRLT